MSLVRNMPIENQKLFEKVILQNDLAGLSPLEKVEHIRNMCFSLGLNPLTKPIQLHKFDGKEIPYMSKDGTEQLRNLHDVSITKLEKEFVKDLYIVTAHAEKPNGRVDCSTSVQSIVGLKGKALENAMKKCETQAKRRVTLSICGLGMLDETEIQDVTARISRPVNLPLVETKKLEDIDDSEMDYQADLNRLKACSSVVDLGEAYKTIVQSWKNRGDSERVKKINSYVGIRKKEIEKIVDSFNEEIDTETGEVKNAD